MNNETRAKIIAKHLRIYVDELYRELEGHNPHIATSVGYVQGIHKSLRLLDKCLGKYVTETKE